MRVAWWAVLAVAIGWSASCVPGPDHPDTTGIGTAAMRAALFDSIVAKTERREAFSPIKENNLRFSALDEMRSLRSSVVDATNATELYYALVRLSNARRDHHLDVTIVSGGLIPEFPPERTAPIRVLPDYSDLDRPAFFIAAVDSSALHDPMPTLGDRIVRINGRTIPEYVDTFRPWVVHSSWHGLYWDMARDLPLRTRSVPPWLYGEDVTLELERRSGERVAVSLPYLHRDSVRIPPVEDPLYPGFNPVMERLDFNVLLPEDGRPVIILQWLDFEDELIQDVVDLMEFAQREELLDHAVIIDVTNSSGGSRGAYAIQRLVDRPFRTTFGNIRLSDAGGDLVRRWADMTLRAGPDIYGLDESGRWLRDWAQTDAMAALARGDDYTRPTPFKLAHLPKDSDGILEPAPIHFSGPIAVIGGPRGGSHVDQFVAMLADNDLALTVGMPTGGYSNTWEVTETLMFPGTDQAVVEFMWSAGHTLRPNGQILEGNPVMPQWYIPLTRQNFRTYHRDLLEAALDGIARGR